MTDEEVDYEMRSCGLALNYILNDHVIPALTDHIQQEI